MEVQVNERFTNTVLQPEDCLLAIAIPLTQEDFYAQQVDENHEFVRRCCSSWTKYQHEIVQVFQDFQTRFEKIGVTVIHDLSADSLTTLFQLQKKHITLIAHWSNENIELCDRMISCDDVVAIVPRDFHGILDLCVCTPEALVKKLKFARPECSIRYIGSTASIVSWIYFYWVFYQYIKTHFEPYPDVIKKLTLEFLKA